MQTAPVVFAFAVVSDLMTHLFGPETRLEFYPCSKPELTLASVRLPSLTKLCCRSFLEEL